MSNRNITFLAGAITIILIVGFFQLNITQDIHPCAANRYPGKCYRLDRSVCEAAWKKYELECTDIIKNLSLAPSRLTGPILDSCQKLRFSRSFAYTKIANVDCDTRASEIEKWQRSNPQF
jgi:hypothetical protein